MTRRRPAPWGAVALAATVVGVLAALPGLLVRHGSVVLHQCVPAEGTAGWLGLRLALLRAEPDCPSGTLAVGGEPRQVLGVVVMVALPLLAAHLVAAAVGIGLAARLHRVVRSAAALLAGVVRRLPGLPGLVVRRLRPAVAAAVARAPRGEPVLGPPRRGPPALRFA